MELIISHTKLFSNFRIVGWYLLCKQSLISLIRCHVLTKLSIKDNYKPPNITKIGHGLVVVVFVLNIPPTAKVI